jgi:hypothetical protein
MKLLGIDTNAKTVKGRKKGYITAITYLAPSDASGVTNTCPNASKGCRAACLFTAGRGRMSNVMQARINKTKFFVEDPNLFMDQLICETSSFIKRAEKKGMIPCERLNGTSDIAWEEILVDGKSIMEHFPNLQFYDYTKRPTRMKAFTGGKLPANYHLTFSRSETTKDSTIKAILRDGGNVAVVYLGELPKEDFGAEVINGDESDLTFTYKSGVIVGLTAKGDAKVDKSGFARLTTV